MRTLDQVAIAYHENSLLDCYSISWELLVRLLSQTWSSKRLAQLPL